MPQRRVLEKTRLVGRINGASKMKTTEEKPREYWVLVIDHEGNPIKHDYKRECFDYEPEHDEKEVLLHTIEYSAYDSLSKELTAEKEKVRKLRDALVIAKVGFFSIEVVIDSPHLNLNIENAKIHCKQRYEEIEKALKQVGEL
jgi:hypothetical protein